MGPDNWLDLNSSHEPLFKNCQGVAGVVSGHFGFGSIRIQRGRIRKFKAHDPDHSVKRNSNNGWRALLPFR